MNPQHSRPAFCWQSKSALRKIRENLSTASEVASALVVYLALTEVSSDKGQPETFQISHQWLGTLSGLSRRTVCKRIADLQKLGLVEVTTPALRTASTYKLLTLGNSFPMLGNGCATLGNGCATLGKQVVKPFPSLEEKKKERGTLGTADRIGLQNRLKITQARLKEARENCPSEYENFPQYASKAKDVHRLKAEVESLETQLLNA